MSNDEKIAMFLELLYNTLKKANTNKQEDIDVSSVDFEPTKHFQLYVGVEGNVVGVDESGGAIDRHFITGYHPIVFSKITSAGTDATDLAALYY